VPVRELQRFHKFFLRQLISRAFDHDDVILSADVNQIEIALHALTVSRIGHEHAVDASDAHGTDWFLEWNIGNAERGRSAID
jgi:hypothetical protein